MHTRKNYSKRNFGNLKNSKTCDNKLHKRLPLSKETVSYDKI